MNDSIVELLQQAEQLKAELDSLRPLDKEREAIVLQKLRLDWNYHSNHLEGNSLTFGETKALILFGITAQGKPLQDHIEITGHDEAIKWIEDVVKKRESLTESCIRQLHVLLLKEPQKVDAITPDGQPTKKLIKVGEYKTTPNHVKTKTGEIFRFASPEETPAKMYDLLEWFKEKEADKETHPILFAADFHYKFIRIHPFDDGNGRMARMLMNFILLQYGYPPVIVRTGEKAQYIAALEQADAGIFDPFIEFIITNQLRSLEIMLKGARGESIEEPDDLDKELALLEQSFKVKGEKIEKYKNNNTLIEFSETILASFENYLIKFYIERFKKFYLNIEISMFRSLDTPIINEYGNPEFFEQIEKTKFNNKRWNIKENDTVLSYYVFFDTLSFSGYQNTRYTSGFDIYLSHTTYTISNKNKEFSITNFYNKTPTNNEYELLLKPEIKRHKDFLGELLNPKPDSSEEELPF